MRKYGIYFLFLVWHKFHNLPTMATIYEKFGLNIKKYRKSLGITQEELAERAKVDPKSVISIENGGRNPTLQTIYRLAKALKVEIKQFF